MADQTQVCRDCGREFPYDEARELCRECAADAVGWTPDYALSLARTALTDPSGLPADVDISGWRPGHEGFDATAYAVGRIDEAIGALTFEAPGDNDEAAEIRWVARNLRRLLLALVAQLDDENDASGIVRHRASIASDVLGDIDLLADA